MLGLDRFGDATNVAVVQLNLRFSHSSSGGGFSER
jgi:hypothetical protein